jgi:hypothetical protein
MKDIITDQEDILFEPLKTIMALADTYGRLQVVAAIHELLEFDLEKIAHCARCRGKAELLYRGLGQLIAAYQREFPSRVDVVGEGIVQ